MVHGAPVAAVIAGVKFDGNEVELVGLGEP